MLPEAGIGMVTAEPASGLFQEAVRVLRGHLTLLGNCMKDLLRTLVPVLILPIELLSANRCFEKSTPSSGKNPNCQSRDGLGHPQAPLPYSRRGKTKTHRSPSGPRSWGD